MTAIKSKKPKNFSNQPIFILCHPRSGSTLLRFILDTHDEVYCPPELQLAREIMSVYDHHLTSLFRPEYPSPDHSGLQRRVRAWMTGTINRFMNPGLKGKKRIWCDKSVTTIDFLPLVKRTYPRARYICLYRNCLDFVHSALQTMKYGMTADWNLAGGYLRHVMKQPENFIDGLVDFWCQETGKILAFQKENEQLCFPIQYESLVFEPEKTCHELFSFLGLSYSKAFLQKVFHTRHQPGPGDFKILATTQIEKYSVGQGRNIPWRMIKPASLQRLNALLREFGYDPVNENWNTYTPSHFMYGAGDPVTLQYAANKLDEIFVRVVPEQLRQRTWPTDLQKKMCKVVIKDVHDAIYFIDFEHQTCQKTDPRKRVDCAITLGFECLVKLQNRTLNLSWAIIEGRVDYQGDQRVGHAVGNLLRS
jgi:hypothetical protein